MDLRLSHAALKRLFGEPVVFIADATAASRLKWIVGKKGAGALVIASAGGCLYLPGENAKVATLPLPGVPGGLVGVVGSTGLRSFYEALEARYLAAQTPDVPPFHALGLPLLGNAALGRFVAEALARNQKRMSGRTAMLERQLVTVREEAERAASRIEVARRMLEGVGYGSDYPVIEAAPGARTLGPAGDLDTTAFSQLLPVDLAGLTRVDVYLTAATGKPGDGILRLRITRAADGTCLAETLLPFKHVETGWAALALVPEQVLAYGDARLDIDWLTGAQGASVPLVSLSDAVPRRFGHDGRTVALRAWRGLTDPMLFGSRPSHGSVFSSHARMRLGPDILDAHRRPDSPKGVARNQDALEMPLQGGNWALIRFAGLVHAGTGCVEAHVRAKDAGLEVLLASVPHDADTDPGELAGEAHTIGEGETTSVCIRLDGQEGADILIAVRPADAGTASLMIEGLTLVSQLQDRTAPENDRTVSQRRAIWPVRFADVMASVVIPGGQKAMASLFKRTGITVVQFVEEAGYLQLHPTLEAPSAVGFVGLLTGETREIRAWVSNASERAPIFRFVIVVAPAGFAMSQDRVASLGDTIMENPAGEALHDDLTGAIWTSADLPGGAAAQLSLKGLEQANGALASREILLMTLPVEGTVGFGWCRWYSLDLISGAAEVS